MRAAGLRWRRPSLHRLAWQRLHWLSWQRLGLTAVLLLAAFLNLYRLDREGNGNQYYTATVFSMLASWRTFFFASFDPGGFVSVDKPPLGFWIQAASAKLLELLGFDFSGLSVLLPEALAGVASVATLYLLVRRASGPVAGLLAALALAVTPVSVAVSRNNTIDALLVLALLVAAWAVFRATERGSLGWLLVAAAMIGLGFEIKMLQAYLAAPAIFLVYLAAAPLGRLVRIGHLALASVVLLVVSFAWPVAVDLTPADQRPYVGSTEDNSAVNLALGYNGVERLLGRGWSLDRLLGQSAASPSDRGAGFGDGTGDVGGPGAGRFNGGPGGIGENGMPGPLRLVNEQLGAQASWLLPPALVGLLVAGWSAWTRRRRLASDPRGQSWFVWGTWLLTAGVFFSVAGYYHSYYLVMLGPPVAALAAIGVQGGWEAYRRSRRLGWLLPLALIGTGALQAYLLASYPAWASWLTPTVLGGAGLAAALLLAVRLARRSLPERSRLTLMTRLAAGLGVVALLLAPAVWSSQPAVAGQAVGGLPSAGPRVARGGFGGLFGGQFGGPGGPGGPPPDGGFNGGGRPDGGPSFDGGRGGAGGFGGFGRGAAPPDEIAYLQANRGSATFLVATTNANAAAPIILKTGQPVMALGGFLGSDPILTVETLTAKIQVGEVRFFLLEGRGGPGGPGGPDGGRNELASWVASTCAAVPASAFSGDAGASGEQGGLYDCANVPATAEASAPAGAS
jgi:4-amino-4-deoxy-L-arabinose transferase-like glycosyltransferase